MSWDFISEPLLQFALKGVAAATGSFLVSIFLIARQADIPRNARYYARQFVIAVLSGVIIGGVPAIAPRFSFMFGFAFPLIWEYLFAPGVERVEFERARVIGIKQALTDAEAAVAKEPDKAKPVWDLSRAQIELYVQRNLRQVFQIFWITVAVMIAGFSLVAVGAWKAFDNQISGALLTAGAGVITQAIGASFLLIYRSTITQASNYVEMLERINAVGMAVNIVDLIPDNEDKLKNEARADLVRSILSQKDTHALTAGRRRTSRDKAAG